MESTLVILTGILTTVCEMGGNFESSLCVSKKVRVLEEGVSGFQVYIVRKEEPGLKMFLKEII